MVGAFNYHDYSDQGTSWTVNQKTLSLQLFESTYSRNPIIADLLIAYFPGLPSAIIG